MWELEAIVINVQVIAFPIHVTFGYSFRRAFNNETADNNKLTFTSSAFEHNRPQKLASRATVITSTILPLFVVRDNIGKRNKLSIFGWV